MDLPIEVAGEGDLAALHVLIEAAYRGDSARRGWTHEADLLGGQRTDIEALAAIVGDPGQRLLVARGPAGLAGCIQIAVKDGGTGYLGLLAVDPEVQANGLGARLIAAAEAHLAQLSASQVEMTVIRQRTELIAYYQRRGYTLTGEVRDFPYGDARFGEPRTGDLAFVVLAKSL
ncbi:GNAT family N-acetyltransferase [Glacieibacterium frigidum]